MFYGSSGAENNYIIDGLNTTGIEIGTEGKTLNFDFVEEIEVKTGGLPAEYGRMTGGAHQRAHEVGRQPRSRATSSASTRAAACRATTRTASERPATTTTVKDIDNRCDFGADLGGYLVKDKLWFFGAYNRTNRTDNFIGDPAAHLAGQPGHRLGHSSATPRATSSPAS